MQNRDNKNPQIDALLAAWNKGDYSALEELMPLIEVELRRRAHIYMQREDGEHTLQTTALVNEVYLQLADQRKVNFQNNTHFYALCATIMRRILMNHARDRIALKRGGGVKHLVLDDAEILTEAKSLELIALDKALEKLTKIDKFKSRIIELRFFVGLTIEETAEALGVAPITVSTHWRFAKAWLTREMTGQPGNKNFLQK